MATNLPEFFTTAGGAIASYDWADYTQAVGYKYFYPCLSTLSGSTVYFISTKSTMESIPQYTDGVGNTIVYQNPVNKNFDLTFGTTALIKGPFYCNLTYGVPVVISPRQVTAYIRISIYHVRGAVETLLGSAESTPRYYMGGECVRECINTALTQIKFNKGDILRINIKIFSSVNAEGSAYNVRLYHDPSSRLTVADNFHTGTIGTDIECHVPFKIDI